MSSSESSEDDDESDSSFDVTSSDFDPVKALESPNRVKLPYPNAPVLDNLSKYTTLFILPPRETSKKKKQDATEPSNVQDAATAGPSKVQHSEIAEPSKVQDVPSDLESAQKKPRIQHLNVLDRMNKFQKGPMSALRDCLEKRVRVKVFTRHMTGIRGYCVAFIAAFDKHWNLALEDVHEVWTRKKKRKVPALGSVPVNQRLAANNRVRVPKVSIISSGRRYEQCERHVGQLMIRGEQVAFISVLG